MSHDIRTPMNAVIGMAAIASANLDNKEKVSGCLKKIDVSSKYLLELIDGVLDMVTIENGAVAIKREDFDINLHLKELFEMFLTQARLKRIELRLEPGNVVHANVSGDMMRFNQVLANIIENALKYTPEDGVVSITANEAPCEMEGYGLYQISVSDNGIGMDETFLERIFEPFERAESSIINKTKGTGLGMAIVKRLVDFMHGTIQVSSRPGEGSRFTVSLPLAWQKAREEQALPPEIVKPRLKKDGKHRVLVVDDNELNVEIARELLGIAGVMAEEACSGKEALKKFEESAEYYYDMILTDIHMPEMDGYEEARLIRGLKRADASGVPILAMTADATQAGRQKALDAGMNGYITKPIDIDELTETMKRFLK